MGKFKNSTKEPTEQDGKVKQQAVRIGKALFESLRASNSYFRSIAFPSEHGCWVRFSDEKTKANDGRYVCLPLHYTDKAFAPTLHRVSEEAQAIYEGKRTIYDFMESKEVDNDQEDDIEAYQQEQERLATAKHRQDKARRFLGAVPEDCRQEFQRRLIAIIPDEHDEVRGWLERRYVLPGKWIGNDPGVFIRNFEDYQNAVKALRDEFINMKQEAIA